MLQKWRLLKLTLAFDVNGDGVSSRRRYTMRNIISRVHTYLIMNWINGMRIWRAVRGEGSELGNSSRARGTPLARGEGSKLGIWPGPKSSPLPLAGVKTDWKWGVGVVEGFWKTRDNGGKAAWLFIGVLSSVYWISDVITDDELAVLIIRACSSRNLFIKHHFTSSHLLNNELNKRYAYLACCPRRGLRPR